jgi:phospholipid/cholesterol/gamma-HCH transport system substrate-binding protein
MPLERKTTWARLRVGVMAIVALVILGVLIVLLSGSNGLFKKEVLLYTYFDNSGAITPGSPVRLNGILIGKVTAVDLTGSNQPGRIVKLTLEVDNNFLPQIPEDSKSETAQLNLLGTKYIFIAKGKSTKPIQPGAEIASAETPELQDMMKQGNVLIGGMQDILSKVNTMLSDIQSGKGSIGKVLYSDDLYNQLMSIMNQAQKLAETFNSNRGIGKFINDDALYTDIRSTIARMNNLIDGIDQGQGTVGKLMKDPGLYNDGRALIADFRKSTGTLQQLLDELQAGKGTAGKLLKSDELADQLKGTIARIDTMLDKINNGQGSLGQLMNNPSLYENLDGATREMHGLMKDFRSNPKKFLRIKLSLF